MVEILKLMLNRDSEIEDLCGTCDLNSTLGSVVPLAMFLIMIGPGTDKKSNNLLNAVNLGKSHKKRKEVLPPNKNGAVQAGGGASKKKQGPEFQGVSGNYF